MTNKQINQSENKHPKSTLVEKLRWYWKKLAPVHGVIYFVVILLCCHFFWKFTVLGDESDKLVTFFGLDISAPFIWMSHHIANAVSYILGDWFGIDLQLYDTTIRFATGNGVRIVWSCTAIKQMYIFFCIIAFYRGPWKHKLWYIPMGLVLVYLFNIFRITFISYVVMEHPERMEFFHDYLFKYLFYGFIFLLWVIWEEKFSKKKSISN